MSELSLTVASTGDLLLVEREKKAPTRSMTRSVRNEVFYGISFGFIRVKETFREERHSRKELGFSLHSRRKTEFFLYRYYWHIWENYCIINMLMKENVLIFSKYIVNYQMIQKKCTCCMYIPRFPENKT